MTAPEAKEIWTVTVVSVNKNRKKLDLDLPSDTTVAALKRLWEETQQLPEGSIMKNKDERRLRDDQRLPEIGEVFPGSNHVCVKAEDAVLVNVDLYKSQTDVKRTVTISLNEKPEAVHQELRQMFSLGEDRYFRLRTSEEPLKYDVIFGNQDIDTGAELFIELGYQIEVMGEWASSVDKRFVFSSETVGDLATEDSNHQRILLDGVAMNPRREIVDELPPDYRRMTQVSVLHQQERTVTSMANSVLKQHLVWPADLVGKVADGRPHVGSDLFFEDERLRADANFKKLNLPDHALVHTVASIDVKLSNGKHRMLRVPKMATTADLKAVVSVLEKTTHFSLKHGGRLLDSSEEIVKLVTDGRSIEVDRPGDTAIVCLPDRSVRFKSEQRQMRFTELMCKVAEKGHLELMCLTDRRLQCQGCGRMLSKQEEEFQFVPADCCRVRSLRLTEWAPPVMRDAETQKSPDVGGRVRRKTVGRRRLAVAAAQQTESSHVSASTQHPPPPVMYPFRIFNEFGIGDGVSYWIWRNRRWVDGQLINIDLALNKQPTVKQVRAEVAAKFTTVTELPPEIVADIAVPPVAVEMWRRIGRRHADNEEMFLIFDDQTEKYEFADASGERSSFGEVDQDLQELKDIDLFPVVPDWRNYIEVIRR